MHSSKVNAVVSKGHVTQVNGRPSASTLNSCIISQLLYRLSTLPFTLKCIHSQLQHLLSTPTFTLNSSIHSLNSNISRTSSRVLTVKSMHSLPQQSSGSTKCKKDKEKEGGRKEREKRWLVSKCIHPGCTCIHRNISPPPPPCLPTLCPRYTTHTYSCCLGKREIGKRTRDKRVRKGHLCANDLNQLPMPATWWSTRRWPSTPPAMHLAPNCLHSLTHARSTHHKRHQKAFTHTTTADR